jgi:hypothetical protein
MPSPLIVQSVAVGEDAAVPSLPQPPVTMRGIRRDAEAVTAGAGAEPSAGGSAAGAYTRSDFSPT